MNNNRSGSSNSSRQIQAENRARILAERKQMAARFPRRSPVDYSSAGAPLPGEPPISVEHDPLLELLKKGQR